MTGWIVAAALGGLLGFGFVALAGRAGRRADALLGAGLVAAAVLYPLMGLPAHALREMPVELAGVAAFTAAALLGASLSPWFLALGWGAHALWDLALPSVTDTAYVPAWYAAACLGFDLAVAGLVAVRARRGRPRAAEPATPAGR
jgi:hypothetical protein